LTDPPTPQEKGFLFETFFYNELKRLRDYYEKLYELCFWREGPHEIDIFVKGPRGPVMAIECRTSSETISGTTLTAFRKKFPKLPLYIASAKDIHLRTLNNGVVVLPWKKALERFLA